MSNPLIPLAAALSLLAATIGAAGAEIRVTDLEGREVAIPAPAGRVLLGFNYEDFLSIVGPGAIDRVAAVSRSPWRDWRPKQYAAYAAAPPAAEALALDACHGRRLRYTNPETGGDAMPTIATFLSVLPEGFAGAPYRSTDSMVYVCVEGSGETTIGGVRFPWGPHDVFVVPSWAEHVHRTLAGEAVLFSFSDRGVQEKLGFWREQKGND